MTLNLSAPHVENELKPRIVVVGVGGAGCNAVNNMISANLEGVEFVVANTDAQALASSQAERRIQLGTHITHGLGAGARPDIGRAAAEEALDSIIDHLQGGHMAFITAGMGGGTGTGAAPVIARAAREHGILTVGVVTKPFHFEGTHRMALADEGIEELQHFVDTLIVIPNQNLFRVCNEKTTFSDAFRMADNVLYSGVRGVTDLMVMPGLINLDFADIRTVMSEMGKAMMGTGEATGDRRAIEAAEAAIANPLLDDVSMKGARGVLINITGGPDMTLFEVDEAANRIREEVDPNAHIIFGSTYDQSLEGVMRVSIVSTGIEAEGSAVLPRPGMISLVHDADRPVTTQKPIVQPSPEALPAMSAPVAVQEPIETAALDPAPEAAPQAVEQESLLAPLAAPEVADTPVATAPRAPTFGNPAPDPLPAAADRVETPAMDKPFIAPPPVQPTPVARNAGPARTATTAPRLDPLIHEPVASEPPRASDPGAGEPGRRRGFSLFQRVTGAVATRKADAVAKRPEEPSLEAGASHSESVAAPASALPPMTSRTVASSGTADPNNVTPPPPAARLDMEDRVARVGEDEDLLEIPAFLRRQAN
ncbi:MAG: cell division protein FtsZ [Alphaproteobacteria bacterium]